MLKTWLPAQVLTLLVSESLKVLALLSLLGMKQKKTVTSQKLAAGSKNLLVETMNCWIVSGNKLNMPLLSILYGLKI